MASVAVSSRRGTVTPGVIVPGSPAGITKLRIAAVSVPTLVTLASVPGSPVVVVPTVILAASPSAPAGPVAPVAPAGPVSPRGITKFNIALVAVPGLGKLLT